MAGDGSDGATGAGNDTQTTAAADRSDGKNEKAQQDGSQQQSAALSQADVDRIVADRLRRDRESRDAALKDKYGDLDDLKTKASQMDGLVESTKSEQERAIENAKSETDKAARAEERSKAAVDLAGQRLHGLLMARGKSEDEADDIVGDLNLGKFVKDGAPDRDELRKAADRLAPKVEPAKPGPVDLGQGPRGGAKESGVAAGSALYESRHPKAKNTT